jgi:hypothetical protein
LFIRQSQIEIEPVTRFAFLSIGEDRQRRFRPGEFANGGES